jgi:HK97 gp10 family phage protein
LIDTKLDFSGIFDISEDLKALSKAENRKVLRDATRAAATVFRDEAKQRAPRKTGRLARNIVVATLRDNDGGITSGVHVRGTNPRTGASDQTLKTGASNNAFYWRFLEFGTSKMPPIPFIRPAYESKEDEAVKVAFDVANLAIDKVLVK